MRLTKSFLLTQCETITHKGLPAVRHWQRNTLNSCHPHSPNRMKDTGFGWQETLSAPNATLDTPTFTLITIIQWLALTAEQE